jgi:hypothetical protein
MIKIKMTRRQAMQHAHNWEFLKEEISITDESTKKPCLEEKSQ